MAKDNKKTRNRRQKVVRNIALILASITLIVAGWIAYQIYQYRYQPDLSETQKVGFSQSLTLHLYQYVTLGSGDQSMKFRFTQLDPPSNPHAECVELCTDVLPTIVTELEYGGRTYRGASASETGTIDLSYTKNGAYPLVPYRIDLEDVNYSQHTATIKVTQQQFTEIELGKEFTLHNDGVGVLTPGNTGLHITFGICGVKTPCIEDVDFYVNGQSVYVPLGFADLNTIGDGQFASKDGTSIKQDGIRLRLIESDDKTYATFVLEKAD